MTHPACACCGVPTFPQRRRHGWCPACYMHWWRAGQPGDGPPPSRRPGPTPQAQAAAQAARDAAHAARQRRLQQYGRLVAAGLPPKAAARQMGISLSTAYYYNRQLRAATATRRGDLRGGEGR